MKNEAQETDFDESADLINQYCGFIIDEDRYVIPVKEVQEVVRPQPITIVPLSPEHVKGLINLRGQIVTSISLRKLFLVETNQDEHMNIIVRFNDSLYALQVDEILDVIELQEEELEKTPASFHGSFKKFVSGVFKRSDGLYVLLDLKKILEV
jgi:purine-binding chemotaxis protein CheW